MRCVGRCAHGAARWPCLVAARCARCCKPAATACQRGGTADHAHQARVAAYRTVTEPTAMPFQLMPSVFPVVTESAQPGAQLCACHDRHEVTLHRPTNQQSNKGATKNQGQTRKSGTGQLSPQTIQSIQRFTLHNSHRALSIAQFSGRVFFRLFKS